MFENASVGKVERQNQSLYSKGLGPHHAPAEVPLETFGDATTAQTWRAKGQLGNNHQEGPHSIFFL